MEETLHATSVVIDGHGLLLCGPSGAGKSDLALRLIDRGALLLSDDYTILRAGSDGRLRGYVPSNIAGKIEVRGIGVMDLPFVENIPIALALDLTAPVIRMPEQPLVLAVAGLSISMMAIAPFEASAPIKAEMMLRHALERYV